MTFGLQVDEPQSRAIMDRAAEGGITFLDLADGYPLGGDLTTVGRTEEIVGRWLHGKRSDFIIATKCYMPMGRNRWERGNSRKHIMESVDASLRRMNTDYIDLYQLHFDDPSVPLDETLQALDDVVRAGKVRYVGASNFLAFRFAKALGRSDVRNLVRFVSIQPRYNLLFREFERELFPLCAEDGIGVIPYNPIAGGMLSGKHDRTKPPEDGGRFTLGTAGKIYQDRYWHDNVFDTVDELVKIAAEAGVALPTLAVAWTLKNPVVTAPIIGASRPEQLDATMAALDYTLDPDLADRLDTVTSAYRRGDAPR